MALSLFLGVDYSNEWNNKVDGPYGDRPTTILLVSVISQERSLNLVI